MGPRDDPKINGVENWAPFLMATGVKKSGVEWGLTVGAHFLDAQIYVDKFNLEKEVESLKVKKWSQQKSTKFSQSKSQFFFFCGWKKFGVSEFQTVFS